MWTPTVGEHVVPMKVVADRLLKLVEDDAIDRRRLLSILRIPMAVVTAGQDAQLRAQKLTSAMPGSWTWNEVEKDLDGIWARYAAAGLAVAEFRKMGSSPPGSAPPGF